MFFFSSRRRHTRYWRDWSSDVCSSDLGAFFEVYLHECLRRMGYSVTCHPELEGTSRRPDFLAKKGGRSIFVEARSASASDVRSEERRVGKECRSRWSPYH